MIARLAGTLVDRDGTDIIIDCGGVGYEVSCSAYTLVALPALGERVTLRIFTQAQENKISLYGFIDAAEHKLFDYLITVKNVGPSTASASRRRRSARSANSRSITASTSPMPPARSCSTPAARRWARIIHAGTMST